jgi:hypothetical protein
VGYHCFTSDDGCHGRLNRHADAVEPAAGHQHRPIEAPSDEKPPDSTFEPVIQVAQLASLVGRWQNITYDERSGWGLIRWFDIRPDGTYVYFSVLGDATRCSKSFGYQGTVQVSGDTITFTPTSGKEGCDKPKEFSGTIDMGTMDGNSKRRFRLSGGELCLHTDGRRESCYSRK